MWPPGLPVFSALTPLPGTPLYARLTRLKRDGRLTRPKHWLDFAPFKLSHSPLKITASEAEKELDKAWRMSYSADRNEKVVNLLITQNPDVSAMHLLARLCFRGIYVPQMTRMAWLNLLLKNPRSILKLLLNAIAKYPEAHDRQTEKVTAPAIN